jgi:hypothetical protein
VEDKNQSKHSRTS